MSLNLHIDRLVIEGASLTYRDRVRLDSEFCSALAELLQSRELHPELARGIAVPSLPVSSMTMPTSTNPSLMGRHLAGSLASALTQPSRSPKT